MEDWGLTYRAGAFTARDADQPCLVIKNLTATSWDGEVCRGAPTSVVRGQGCQAALAAHLATFQGTALTVIDKAAAGAGLTTCTTPTSLLAYSHKRRKQSALRLPPMPDITTASRQSTGYGMEGFALRRYLGSGMNAVTTRTTSQYQRKNCLCKFRQHECVRSHMTEQALFLMS